MVVLAFANPSVTRVQVGGWFMIYGQMLTFEKRSLSRHPVSPAGWLFEFALARAGFVGGRFHRLLLR